MRFRAALVGTAAAVTLWLGGAAALAAPAEDTLQVLHWWTSASERKAADLLARRLAAEGVSWEDAAIPGGAGQGAGKVLRSRLLAGTAPEITQLIGISISEWAEAGLLIEFDGVAAAGHWAAVLFPTVNSLIRHRGHVVAAPLGIHRINTLFVNPRVFARLHLVPPATWAEFERLAPRLQAAGVVPLAQSSEPWQVATLFESLVLAEGGVVLHRELFVKLSPTAAADRRVAAALERLRALKAWMGPTVPEQPWTEGVARLARGEAAMLVMGDWAKGELNAAGAVTGEDFACLPAPGTARVHLYSVDTLSGFAADYSHAAAQEKLARTVLNPATQLEYNAIKGSVPVRRDIDPARLDTCARASYTAFARDPAQLAPSLVHRMATDEASKDAIIAEVHRYFVDERVAGAEMQRRLAAIFRALPARTASGAAESR